MIKRILSLVLACGFVVTLAACAAVPEESSEPAASGSEAAAAETAAPETEQTESQLPAGPVEIELWTDMTIDETVLTNAIEKFEAAYADQGYTIKLNKFAGSERNKLISAAIETKTLPALLLSAWFTTADYVHQGLVENITDLADTVKDDMYASVYNTTLINGNSYMVGLYQSYNGLLYNADLFKAAGLGQYVPDNEYEVAKWTVSDMENVILPTLAQQFAGTQNYPMAFFAADSQADTFMLNWLTMLGGKLWDNGYSIAGDDENTVAALEKMISWTNAGLTNSNVVTKSGTEVGGEFKNQMSAIVNGQITNYTSNLAAMEKGDIEKFDMRIAAIPVYADGKDTCTMANYVYGAAVINNGNDDQIAVAKEFVRWLLSDTETLTAFGLNALPCYQSVLSATEADHPLFTEMAKMEPYVWDFTGGVPGYVSTRAYLFPELQAAFSGEKTAAQALSDYEANANEVIQDYMDNSLVLNG
ncbi:MAG TPA: hypothetical protein P5075_08465 [Eubacteriales bacterium]|nr:hypothetical protein [Eubacteriales bacterium]